MATYSRSFELEAATGGMLADYESFSDREVAFSADGRVWIRMWHGPGNLPGHWMLESGGRVTYRKLCREAREADSRSGLYDLSLIPSRPHRIV